MTSVLAILSPMRFLVMMNANISIQFNSQGMLRRIPLGFTCEKSVVDLLSVSVNSVAGDSTQIQVEDPDSSTTSFAVRNGVETGRRLQDMRGAKVYDVRGRLLGTADSPRVKEMRLRKARQPVFAK